MNSAMHFGWVQPNFLWALAGLAIPVIVHLVFKRRSRKIDLGTLRFLKAVVQANARSRNLKRWLLLVMRLACVALLVTVFARPHLRGFEAVTSKQFLCVLIDQSASMQRYASEGRLVDQAVSEARKLIRESMGDIEVQVAFFDHAIHPVILTGADGKPDPSAWQGLQAPQSLSGATDYSLAMEWARDVCVTSNHQRRRVVLYTDLQRSGLDWTETKSLPSDVSVHVVDLGQPQSNNAAITSIHLAAPVVRPGKSTVVTATVYNAGPFAMEKVDVVLHASRGDRQLNVRQQVSLTAGSTGLVDFETPQLAEGFWQGYVELEHEDDLKFDNKRWLAALVAPPLSTLIVEGQPDRLPQRTAAYYLETSLRLGSPGEVAIERSFESTTLTYQRETNWPDLKRQSLIILANVPSLTAAEAGRLAAWVRDGGGLLVFAGEPTTAEGMQSLSSAGLGVGTIRGFATSNDVPWRFEKWEATHPIFEIFGDAQRGDLSRRAFRGITRIEPEANVNVLARFTGGAPAVLERALENGRVIWFAAGCDGKWSDWPRSRLYLPLNYQLLSYLGGLSEGGPVRNLTIDGTNERELSPGVVAENNHWNVINISPRESETDRCEIDELANRFGFDTDKNAADSSVSTQLLSNGIDARDDEIWPAVVLVLLGMLMAEGLLGNRTTS